MSDFLRDTSRISTADALPYALVLAGLAVLLSAALLIGLLGRHGPRHWELTWGVSWQHAGVLHLGLLLLAGVLIVSILQGLVSRQPSVEALIPQVMEVLLPLAAGVMAAFSFAPDDEPSLELLLTAPRPAYYVLLERLSTLLLPLAVIGVGFPLLLHLLGINGVLRIEHLSGWVAPTVLMVGLSVRLTLQTRRAPAAILVVLLLWSAMTVGGFSLLMNFPLTATAYFFLTPQHVGWDAYTVNRLLLTSAGMLMIVHTLWLTLDEDRLLRV